MRAFDLFTDAELSRELAACVSRERTSIAEFIACIEEFDRRRLYVPAGYASLYLYCVDKLGLSEDAACMRIRAARASRRFPILLEMLEDGRLHLTGVSLLASHLTSENVDELLRSSVRKGKRAIAELIAARFPETESLPLVEVVPPATHSPIPSNTATFQDLSVPERINIGPLDQTTSPLEAKSLYAPAPSPPPVIRPIAQERYSIHITVSKVARDKLDYAQALLSHSIPSGDLAEVFERALDTLITAIERRRFADVENPRTSPSGTHGRTIPAEVRRVVWRRDEGRCTFVGEDGHRCDEWRFLEFDHVEPVALGGLPNAEGVRLRCRAHNQYEAERVLGEDFMARKMAGEAG